MKITTETKTADLIAFYNENLETLPSNALNSRKPVKKFADRKTAVKRVETLIADLDLLACHGEVNCPHCDTHLSNGVVGDEGNGGYEVNDEFIKLTHASVCLACGEEFGPLVDEKKAAKKSTTRSAGVAKSWENAEIAAKRAERHGCEVSVKIDGKKQTFYFGSVAKAFAGLGLPASGRIAFRMALKESKTCKENGRNWKIVPLKTKEAAKESADKAAPLLQALLAI